MGNCQSNKPVVASNTPNNSNGKRPNKDPTSLQEGLLRERNLDVYSKYQQLEVLGQGSMGQVVRVRLIDDPLKGSKLATDRNQILASTNSTSNISEKRYDKVEYGLKSIHTDRVSPQFLQELKNEIEILRKMVRQCSSLSLYFGVISLKSDSIVARVHHRTIPILSRPMKSITTKNTFISYWNYATVVIYIRVFLIQKNELQRLLESSCRQSSISMITVLSIVISNLKMSCLKARRKMQTSS